MRAQPPRAPPPTQDEAVQGGFAPLEFFPLVNPRAHELRGRKAVLNQVRVRVHVS